MTYDPKFTQKQMYDQYGRSRKTTPKVDPKPSRGSGFSGMGPDPAEKFGGSPTKGLGSKPFERGSTYDAIPTFPKDDKPEPPTRFVDTVKNKAVELFKFFGGDDPKDTTVDPSQVYRGPMFRGPINPGVIEARIKDAVDYSKAPPMVYTAYGSTYDEVPPASANQNLMKNAVNKFLRQKGLNSREYTIERGDTLSEIAQREGISEDDLAKINKIENKNRIYAGETLIIPTPQEVERVKDIVDTMDPDAQFYQSGVPLDQRVFEPELGYDEIPLPSQATVDRRTSKGLGVIPEVTVTELDDYVAAEDTTRTSETPNAPTPDYATMSFGEAGRPDTGGIMTKPKLRPGSKISEKKLIQRTLNDLGYNAGAVDGDIGKGTQRAIRKFQKQHGLEPTGIVDPKTYDAIVSGESDAYPDPVQNIPTSEIESITSDVGDFEIMKKALAKIESGPHGYSVYKFDVKNDDGKIIHKAGDLLYGGANNHYLGKYQMGRDALSDVGVGYSKAEREAFLKDPVAQDKAFKEYTENNHKKLTRESERYRNMTKEEKLGVLGYAHNQGATAAIEWLFTGVSGADANGTKGTKYTTKIAEAFADPNAAAVREFYEVTP